MFPRAGGSRDAVESTARYVNFSDENETDDPSGSCEKEVKETAKQHCSCRPPDLGPAMFYKTVQCDPAPIPLSKLLGKLTKSDDSVT